MIDLLSPTDKRLYSWYAQNALRISKRLKWLQKTPDGILLEQSGNDDHIETIVVVKSGTQIILYFVDKPDSHNRVRLSGIMSKIDIYNPLMLIDIYTQAMVLALVLNNNPKKVYMLGFGGGRIPMIFHHYFPEIMVEGAENNPMVVSIMKKFFGIKPDHRIKIAVEDGERHLSSLTNTRYDIIMVDCYTGIGHQPFTRSPAEFYKTCKSRLTECGVIATNLIDGDPLFANKLTSLRSAFRYTYGFMHENLRVYFGTDVADLTQPDFIIRAEQLASRHHFCFPLVERAKNVKLPFKAA